MELPFITVEGHASPQNEAAKRGKGVRNYDRDKNHRLLGKSLQSSCSTKYTYLAQLRAPSADTNLLETRVHMDVSCKQIEQRRKEASEQLNLSCLIRNPPLQ